MKEKSTKRALFSSVAVLLLCVSMMIGTTFAWFNANASATVNEITTGTLTISLNGNSNNEATLSFVGAAGSSDPILWEPGCTYDLQTLTVKNTGSLALKYEVKIDSADASSADLAGKLDWTIENNSGNLAAGSSQAVNISAKLSTEAGNDLQGLTLSGVKVKVIATQYTSEIDATGTNTYDQDAAFPES